MFLRENYQSLKKEVEIANIIWNENNNNKIYRFGLSLEWSILNEVKSIPNIKLNWFGLVLIQTRKEKNKINLIDQFGLECQTHRIVDLIFFFLLVKYHSARNPRRQVWCLEIHFVLLKFLWFLWNCDIQMRCYNMILISPS